MDWVTGVWSLTEAEDISLLLCPASSGAHPASCMVGIGGSLPGGKVQPGHDVDHSPLSSAEVKKGGGVPYLLFSEAPFMVCSGSTLLLVPFKYLLTLSILPELSF
jgi:hypothetical protein